MKSDKLIRSYEEKWDEFKIKNGIDYQKLSLSKKLFNESIVNNKIKYEPIKVNLFALLAGIPFEKNCINSLYKIQSKIFDNLDDSRIYKVMKKNFGLECLVLKWHDEKDFLETNISLFKEYLNQLNLSKYEIKFKGVQIHRDGCVISKFIDYNGEFRSLRKNLLMNFNFLPEKQSNWVHIPLGRILYELNNKEIDKLISECEEINDTVNFQIEIDKYSLVHEKRWYMEEKEYLMIKELN